MTPKKYPAGNIVVTFKSLLENLNLVTNSNETGHFILLFNISTQSSLQGQLQLNLANQYYQELNIRLNSTNSWSVSIGQLILNNNATEKVQFLFSSDYSIRHP
jgi:hypothetical protein